MHLQIQSIKVSACCKIQIRNHCRGIGIHIHIHIHIQVHIIKICGDLEAPKKKTQEMGASGGGKGRCSQVNNQVINNVQPRGYGFGSHSNTLPHHHHHLHAILHLQPTICRPRSFLGSSCWLGLCARLIKLINIWGTRLAWQNKQTDNKFSFALFTLFFIYFFFGYRRWMLFSLLPMIRMCPVSGS